MNLKSFLPICLIFFISSCFIAYFTINQIRSSHELRRLSVEFSNYEPIPTVDLKDPKTKEAIIKRVKHFESIERYPVMHLNAFEEEEQRKKESRSLASSNVFEDVALVDVTEIGNYYLSQWLLSNMQQYSTDAIVYPYAFDYQYKSIEDEDVVKHYSYGGYISKNPESLDPYTFGLKTNSTVSINKARALYDQDIAILSFEYMVTDYNEDLFQDSVDWCTYFQSSIAKGRCNSNYDEYLSAKKSNPTKNVIVKLNYTDIRNGLLMTEDGFPRFGILIIPDYKHGVESYIISLLKDVGAKNIVKFFQEGGKIIANGKSGALLESIGLVNKGTYDRTKLFSSDTANRQIKIQGCENIKDQTFADVSGDFDLHLLCMGITTGTRPALSTTFKMIKNKDTSYKVILSIDPTFGELIYTDTSNGIPIELTEDDKKFLPLILRKSNSKGGDVFLLNFNPVYASSNKMVLLNLLVLASAKEMYMSSKVKMENYNVENIKDMPIPAGEAGVELQINTLFHNLNDEKINNFKMYVFLPDNFEWHKYPSTCTKETDESLIPKNIKVKKTFTSGNPFLICKEASIETYEKRLFNLYITVLNYQATQEKINILILEPIVSYTDSKGTETILPEYVKVSAQAAPVLRAGINPDPSAFYPYYGRGQYVDNGLKVENKEDSEAFDIEYVGLVPLVSPVVDISDQRMVRWTIKILVDYYNSHGFDVPLVADNAQDYVYTGELINKGVKIVAEWDNPVLPVKEILPNIASGQDFLIEGLNLGMITITSTSEVIRQVNYRKSDRFYKLASQRLMVFVDTSTPEGMKARYGSYDKVPDEWKDPVLKDRCKKEFMFSRSDIFFYDNENYVNPPGISDRHVLTVDKYKPYTKNAEGCVTKRGDARSKRLVQGYFNNFDSDKRDTILKESEWSNELFEYCDQIVINGTNEEEIIKEFGSLDNIKPVHYVIPNVVDSVKQPGQIYGFKQKNQYNGYLEEYPSVKFIYLHSMTFIIPTKYCLYGGLLEINLGSTYKLKSLDDLTLSPDQIAFYKTEYDSSTNIIKAYFKRGLMSNEQFGKDMSITVNIENLSSTSDLSFDVSLYQMKYDVSYPPTYEQYYKYYTEAKTFNYISAFSFPAIQFTTHLNRSMGAFETIEPFSRYGTYIQELIKHRPIYGYGESHHESSPGLQGVSGGFSLISNLGISSIPFLEYVTAGAGQVIPAGPSTSRTSWTDIWGRRWHQPLRSVFPDVPPVPPPIKNFMMTTTFEVLRNGKLTTEWASDENVQVHMHIKLLNNYQKYFEITRCQDNQIRFVPKKIKEEHLREFEVKSVDDLLESEMNGNNMFLSKGGFAAYGKCFQDDNAVVSGVRVEGDLRKQIEKATLCSDSTDPDEIAQCAKDLEGITTIHKVKDDFNKTQIWNYSPLVEAHYPKDYIEDWMWQMDSFEYDDTPMDKAYKYHIDDLLPNLDNDINKPQNTIAVPIYKGVGYEISYDKDNSMNYHGVTKKGWWGDNLQNKDDTLVAGNEVANKISVNKKSSITNWVEYKDLHGSKRSGSEQNVKDIVNERIKNIYVCLYNRKRPQHIPDNSRNYYTNNVDENNVIPIIVDLDKNDKRLTQYDCKEEQYTPDNLYTLMDNYLATPTGKDYLYFAANLRGGAKESFNVLMNLNYIEKAKIEGVIKVSEGGRFVYFNPPNGPNSYLIVDSPVSLINAKRNDIEIKNEIFPLRTTTFNAVVYHLYTFYDENKIKKEWPYYESYTNNYGFGDVTISIFVGKLRNSKAVLEPGETTYVKIDVLNNCGFDWNMYVSAIDFEYIDDKPLNANDLYWRWTHTIQKPLKYNFLKYTVDDLYKEYIEIEPSDHNIEVAPEFFDFDNINVVTIRDGFKGEYYLKVKLSEKFPDNLRGRPIQIKVEFDEKHFDHFPGSDTDPIKEYHNYKVEIPPVYIAVPFKGGENDGKVFYTSAQATDLDMKFNLGIDWHIDGIKYIANETIEEIRKASTEEEFSKMLESTFNKLPGKSLAFTEEEKGEVKTISVTGIKADYPQFPKTNIGDIDIATVSFIVKSTVDQLKYGYTYPITEVKMPYKDWIGKTKTAIGEKPQLYAEGAWLELSYTRTLVDEVSPGVYVDSPDQTLSVTDEGIMKVQFKLQNVGNGISYNTNYEIVIQPNLTYISSVSGRHKITQKMNNKQQTILNFDYGTPINAGELKGGIIYLKFKKYISDEEYDKLTEEEIAKLPTELPIVQESSARIDLTNITGEVQVTQHLRQKLVFDYNKQNKTYVYMDLIVSGSRSNPTVEIIPKIKHVEGETDQDILASMAKIDLTDYPANYEELRLLLEEAEEEKQYNYSYLYRNSTPISKKDKPIVKAKTLKNHVVLYSVSSMNKNTFVVSSAFLKYEQETIGLSIYEYILIILSILFYSATAFLIYLTYKNWRLRKTGGYLEKQIQNIETQMDSLIQD